MTPKPLTAVTDHHSVDGQKNSSTTANRMIKRQPLSSFGDHYHIGEEIGR